MRRFLSVTLVAIVLLLVAAPASEADGRRHRSHRGHGFHRHHGLHRHHLAHTRVFIGVGPAFYWGPRAYWGYPYYYPPPYYVYTPPPVVVQEPPVYVQQSVTAPQPAEAYWYYCPPAQAYYPTVESCPEAWVRVPPRPQ